MENLGQVRGSRSQNKHPVYCLLRFTSSLVRDLEYFPPFIQQVSPLKDKMLFSYCSEQFLKRAVWRKYSKDMVEKEHQNHEVQNFIRGKIGCADILTFKGGETAGQALRQAISDLGIFFLLHSHIFGCTAMQTD